MQRSGRKKRHWARWTILVLIALVLISGGIFVYHLYKVTETSFNKMYAPNGQTPSTAIKQGQPFSVLILGVDTGADGRIDKGNSDTLIVATVNPQTRKTVLHSIPRDTLAEMSGDKKRNMQKLNAAYNLGGAKMAKASISKLVGIPIDYYLTMNMGGLETMVNAVGGITVTSDLTFTFNNITIQKGTHHLNGKEALTYARMRYDDPKGDYGRQIRQQTVIRSVMKKLISTDGLSRYQKLMTALEPNVRTDVPFKAIVTGGLKYRHNAGNISSQQLQGSDAWINGSSYQIATTAALTKTANALRRELQLPAKQIDNEETKLNALNPTFDGKNSQLYNTFGLDTVYYTDNTY
ncbi:LCP family protein [Loigolactobacillus coryniformis]|uniref:LCP family protein n=1 Tax=Loigolactobacillus coryniformis TaxID=1610 RepID=UPI00233FCDAF|nr:LCP family protein [Loigolactobacillus coryniformis]MDC4185314.1 LCP family protein [Loigolactobacillus coryniformis]